MSEILQDQVEQAGPQKEVRFVTAPLSMDQLKEIITNPNLTFVLRLKDSQLKGHSLLVYLSNLEISAELDFTGLSEEAIHELLEAYFTSKSIVRSLSLSVLAGQVILDSVGCQSDQFYQGCALNVEQRQKFITQHTALVKAWAQFLASSLMFGIMSFPAIEEKENFKARLPVINDLDAVGYNIVNMFSSPGFMEIFFAAAPAYESHYYTHQFEEYMFKGKNLFYYFTSPDNMMSVLLQALLLTEDGAQKLIEATFGGTEWEKKSPSL